MKTLRDKVVLITGAAGGLGASIGSVLAAEKMQVVLGDIQKDLVEKTAEHLRTKGGRVEGLFLDVTRDESARKVCKHIIETYGGLDVLINNAGTDTTAPFTELSMEQFDRIMNVNLRGPVLLTKLFISELSKRRGSIINVGSTASERAWPNATAYHASKWGLIGFSRALYTEARQVGVKVSTLIPGGMKTPHLLHRFPDIDQTKLQDAECVADVVKYLLQQPEQTIIPEVMVLPMLETSWP